jgi:hypothetical protein
VKTKLFAQDGGQSAIDSEAFYQRIVLAAKLNKLVHFQWTVAVVSGDCGQFIFHQ